MQNNIIYIKKLKLKFKIVYTIVMSLKIINCWGYIFSIYEKTTLKNKILKNQINFLFVNTALSIIQLTVKSTNAKQKCG